MEIKDITIDELLSLGFTECDFKIDSGKTFERDGVFLELDDDNEWGIWKCNTDRELIKDRDDIDWVPIRSLKRLSKNQLVDLHYLLTGIALPESAERFRIDSSKDHTNAYRGKEQKPDSEFVSGSYVIHRFGSDFKVWKNGELINSENDPLVTLLKTYANTPLEPIVGEKEYDRFPDNTDGKVYEAKHSGENSLKEVPAPNYSIFNGLIHKAIDMGYTLPSTEHLKKIRETTTEIPPRIPEGELKDFFDLEKEHRNGC